MVEAELKKIMALYFQAKELFILAEETDPTFQAYLQPHEELTRALDHLARAHARELGMPEASESKSDGKYVEIQLSKCFGHMYRAFFDAADWLAGNLREKLNNDINSFSTAGLSAVFPEYYRDIKPNIPRLNEDIAQLRNDKDVANDEILEEVKKYQKILDKLMEWWKLSSSKMPTIIEYEKKRKREKYKWMAFALIVSLILRELVPVIINHFN